MKRTSIFVMSMILLVMLTTNCGMPGDARLRLHGDEGNLPPELKGLKVYNVKLGGPEHIKIAVIDNKVVGTSYLEGKVDTHVGIVDLNKVKKNSIVYEDDNFIIIRKK